MANNKNKNEQTWEGWPHFEDSLEGNVEFPQYRRALWSRMNPNQLSVEKVQFPRWYKDKTFFDSNNSTLVAPDELVWPSWDKP